MTTARCLEKRSDPGDRFYQRGEISAARRACGEAVAPSAVRRYRVIAGARIDGTTAAVGHGMPSHLRVVRTEPPISARATPANVDERARWTCIEVILREVVRNVEDALERGRVRLIVTSGLGSVRGDAVRLTEGLRNVVESAIAATPPNGVVRLTTRETIAGDREWHVAVSARGVEIGVGTIVKM